MKVLFLVYIVYSFAYSTLGIFNTTAFYLSKKKKKKEKYCW